MPQAYSDPRRENDPHGLPDVETFQDFTYDCEECGAIGPAFRDYYGIARLDCDACGARESRRLNLDAGRWYWWRCFPGCLPDGDPIGPFETEAEALADAREGYTD